MILALQNNDFVMPFIFFESKLFAAISHQYMQEMAPFMSGDTNRGVRIIVQCMPGLREQHVRIFI